MKHTLLFIFLLFFSLAVLAQSDNLCPESSVPTVPINACGPTSYSVASGFGVDPFVPTGTTCVTASNLRGDGWFKFTAISTQTVVIGTITGGRNLAIMIYEGSCADTMVEVGGAACVNALGNNGREFLNLTTVVGTTYFIRLAKFGNTGVHNGTISVLSPVSNDDCSDAISITPAPASFTPTCNSQACGNTYYATTSPPTPACGGSDDADVWYKFVATQAQHTIEVGSSLGFNAIVEVLSGSCGSLVSRGCANAGGTGILENLSLSNFVAGNTYYIRVYDAGAVPPNTFEFYVCVKSPIVPTCPASLGGGVVNIASLPYNGTGLTTVGNGDEFSAASTITCGSSTYLSGPDNVYIFTPGATGSISVTLTSGSNNVGIMLYDDCPFINSGSNCVAYSQSNSGNQFFCANVTSGTTYYLIVDRNNASGFNNFSLTITAPATGNTGATCATAVSIPGFPYSIANQTTQCKGDDYDNSSPGSCGTVYESGEDMVFSYNASTATCLQITLSNTVNQAGLSVYQGCPSSGSSSCLGSLSGNNASSNFTLPAAGTYYIVVDSWDPPSNITFDLDITTTPGASPNDYPCSATTLPLGTTLPGDNRCSNALLEPGNASCWTGGTLNTVWYRVTPSGTTLNIRTTLGSLTNTQIALYSGSCGSLTQVAPTANTCNRDETSCAGVVTLNSQLTVTGLTAGTQYYIRVDGENNLTGTFSIVAVDATSGLPFVSGQDCGAPLSVCQSNFVSNPGYSGNGNYCDFNASSNCITTGEINSVWYTIPIASNGTLMFDIIPNDWPGSGTSSSDFDFAIWQTNGLNCLDLLNTTPTRCNSDALGLTGTNTGGNAPAAYPGFNNSYENSIAVTAGQTYKLMISNISGSNSGFTLNISSSPDPLSYPSPPATLNWVGITNTNWTVASNWGACSLPTCGINVVCTSAPSNQPVLSTSQTVKDITINAGSTLTINPNVVLSVCGNFTNNGNLVTGAGSIITFIGSGNQAIFGNLTGVNAFANLTMNKPAGSLTLQANIDIKENDSLLSGLFQTNGKTIKIKKNFHNANGATTHVPIATGSTYEFNGNAPQTFTNIGSEIDLNNVIMNQSVASSLTLNTGAFNNLNVIGILTLTNGKIITGAREVYIKNKAIGGCTNGNVNSYVEGFLRRNLNTPTATGNYQFPVGNSAKGYQRASVNFTAATSIPNLLASFTSWGAVPVGPVSSDCNTANYSLTPALNNGFWTIEASANGSTGTYLMTLYNRSYTNAANGWTVMKRTPAGTGPWTLIGTCVLGSIPDSTKRSLMSGFSDFATAQSNTPLPIELIRFDAVVKSTGVLTTWETASEINNNFFDVERSKDGYNFERLGTITGAGTSTQIHQYSFMDTDPGIGIIYYRLKQVDFDGGFSYSDVVALKVNLGRYEISIYPNPANSSINFEFESARNSRVNYQVSDMMGKILINETKEIGKGNINSQLDIKNLPEGVYNLKVVESDAIYKGKFVKLDE